MGSFVFVANIVTGKSLTTWVGGESRFLSADVRNPTRQWSRPQIAGFVLVYIFSRRLILIVRRASRFRLLNPPDNPPACFTNRVPVASGVGGGLGAQPANGCRGPSVTGGSSEASPQVGVCKTRSFQSDVDPSARQWSRPLSIGRFSGGVVSRRLTLSLGVRVGMGCRVAG